MRRCEIFSAPCIWANSEFLEAPSRKCKIKVSTEIKVLFVCLGNICRSPTAEAVFRHYVENAGLSEHILIDSAGTHDYHIGDPPDSRARHAAQQRGYDTVSYTHLRAHETRHDLVCRLLLEKK